MTSTNPGSVYTITLWATYAGQPCTPINDPLAHEFGHVLGLADPADPQACAGRIMGSRNPGQTRTIGSSECLTANNHWETPAEVPPPPPPPPIEMCDPGHNCDGSEPLVLDLDGDGIPTSSVFDSPVWFDMDGDGTKDQTGWTQGGANDAFLFYDTNGNGVVDDASELFGDANIRAQGRTGFAILATYDRPDHGGDADFTISPADGIWGKLRLWVDGNHDGVCERSETRTLGRAGVVRIPLEFNVSGVNENYGSDAAGNLHYLNGVFQVRDRNRDGLACRSIEDIYFVVRRP